MSNQGKRNHLVILAVAGGLIVAVILILGTIWTGSSASLDTERAVRNVSLLYLDELAGRREQVVSSVLNGYIKDMDIAIGLLEKDDLSSVEKLQAYQARMRRLYDLEKFAFVDENGLIYTSRGTRNDIDQYAFDPKTLSEPEISIKRGQGKSKKMVIAMPVDSLPLAGKHLMVCFMEMDMEKLVESVSLQSGLNSTTFCNLYTADGESLTSTVLGGLSSESNLLTALEKASFEEGYGIAAMKDNFAKGESGVASFTFSNIRETMYYVPVHQTNWMLTYLIRESVISEQIGAISNGIIQRSVILSLVIAAALSVLFGMMIRQSRKASSLKYEKETAELMQQELEERIALQDELLEQEKIRTQQDSMITALASDYTSVYYVDLDTGDSICYRKGNNMDYVDEGEHFNFHKGFEEYAALHVHEDYRDGFLSFIKPENIRKGLEKEPLIAFRYLARRAEGDVYEMLRMAGVRHPEDRDDHIVHAVGVGFSDIDMQMRDSLEKNQALIDALKSAEEASKAKTAFLSSMSHEIRTPMNAIIGLDQLALNEKDLPAGTRDYLEKIGSSAQHLLSLINDILDMSRIESGRMVMRNEEFAFSKLMEQINIIVSGQCRDKGLTYECRIDGELNDYYIGDGTKLRQVLINILGNAVKFTPEGGRVELSVEKTGSFDGKTAFRFRISDTGIGMSREYLPKIFEAFSQEDATSTNKFGSTGLGMAITKNIVEMMNGRIDVESEKGVGTTFIVSLTLMDSDKVLTKGCDEELSPQEMNVLVIDDDPIACEHAKLVLGKLGIAAETALSGKEAVEMVRLRHARHKAYNLIIVDWQMPEMDGVETTRQIRSIIGEESAIIILTAYNWDDVLEEASAAGVDSFIAKPLFSGNVLEEFKNALKKKHIAAQGKGKAKLEGRHLLVAEDVEINAEIMLSILEQREITAEIAENGRVAVEKFAESPVGYFDAILMDMRMPEMDGIEASMKIRAMEREDAKSIPIIALTANAFDEDVQRSLQAGLNAHLTKPVEQDILFETLENIL